MRLFDIFLQFLTEMTLEVSCIPLQDLREALIHSSTLLFLPSALPFALLFTLPSALPFLLDLLALSALFGYLWMHWASFNLLKRRHLGENGLSYRRVLLLTGHGRLESYLLYTIQSFSLTWPSPPSSHYSISIIKDAKRRRR